MTSGSLASGDSVELRIAGPAAGGTSVARLDGRVVFVAGALHGELVRARLTETGKVLRAEVTEVLEPSAHRVPDRRTGFLAEVDDGLFGGMEYAHVDLAHSRELKGQVIADQLSRIGRIDRDVTVTAAPGEETGLEWRTRIQLAVSGTGELGMLRSRSHDVIPVTRAPLAVPAIAEADLRSLRLPGAERVEFAWAGSTGAVIVRGETDRAGLDALAESLPEQWSILAGPAAPTRTSGRPSAADRGRHRGQGRGGRRHRGAGRSTASAPVLEVIRGTDHLLQTAAGRDFRVAADGFWQVHTDAPDVLTEAVRAAVPADARTLTDLYCGVGLLGITAAEATGARLFGVEGVGPAIENARINAAGIDAQFVAGRVDTADFPSSDVLLLDPPRAGAGKAVTDRLIADGPETIVYVSCDAGTLARDLGQLSAGGYAIESLVGHALFPLTAHVETVTVLRR